MRLRRSTILVSVEATAALGLALAPPAAADDDEVTVRAGESIQDAIDDADEGTTIHVKAGTYHESLTIMTDGIELRGKDVRLTPPQEAAPTPCDIGPGGEVGPASGVCIIGQIEGETVARPVSDVSVSGFTVHGFGGTGLIAFGTEDLRVMDSKFVGNGGYGAASFVTMGTTFEDNVAKGNHEAGFYVGDSPEADAKVEDNVSVGNEMGFFFRNASHGKAEDNVAKGNCLGMLVLAGAPGAATDWELEENKVQDNDRVCAPPEYPFPLSGAGIVLFGAQDFGVEENKVIGNGSAAPSLAEGGIVVMTSAFNPAESFEPSGEIEDNQAFGNEPADINWDGTGDVEFDDNECKTSMPAGLCEDD